jgi:hypothetical protein
MQTYVCDRTMVLDDLGVDASCVTGAEHGYPES